MSIFHPKDSLNNVMWDGLKLNHKLQNFVMENIIPTSEHTAYERLLKGKPLCN
jgi:hypothetical protein